MKSGIALFAFISIILLPSCSKKENAEALKPADEASKAAAGPPAAAQSAGGPHAFVNLKSGGKVPGTIVASSQTDMVVAGDDGIQHKIPFSQIKSVDYGDTASADARSSREPAPPKRLAKEEP